MSSTAEMLMLDVLGRLVTAAVIADVTNIRRDHRTVVSRENTPRVHVVDGDEDPQPGKNCYVNVQFAWKLSIFVRDDLGFAAAGPIAIRCMEALNPITTPYGDGIELRRGRIIRTPEIADADSLQVDMEFSFHFTTPEWEL